jgi:hypothetical protein
MINRAKYNKDRVGLIIFRLVAALTTALALDMQEWACVILLTSIYLFVESIISNS